MQVVLTQLNTMAKRQNEHHQLPIERLTRLLDESKEKETEFLEALCKLKQKETLNVGEKQQIILNDSVYLNTKWQEVEQTKTVFINKLKDCQTTLDQCKAEIRRNRYPTD